MYFSWHLSCPCQGEVSWEGGVVRDIRCFLRRVRAEHNSEWVSPQVSPACILYRNWKRLMVELKRNNEKEILKTLRWVPCQLKLFIQLSWFVRSRKSESEGCHHFDFKYLTGLTFLSIVWKLSKRGVLFATNQTGRWLCNVVARKRKAFIQESRSSFAYYSGEKNICISSIHSSSSHKEIQLY